MPAKDLYHQAVKNALIKDGWNITHDPLHLKYGLKDLYVDLGAERLLAAEKADRKIAVEVKTFVGASEMEDLEKAFGQYVLYRAVLARLEPDRELYLAVSQKTWEDLFEEPIGKLALEDQRALMLVFNPVEEVVLRWIP